MTIRVPIGPREPMDGAIHGSVDGAGRLSPHAAVIEQAKGVIMARYVVSADAAFEMIRKWSRDRNLKVRDVAARLVDAAAQSAARDDTSVVAPSRITLDEALDAVSRVAVRHRAEQARPPTR